ncbi:MAG: hypothetical protein JWP27_1964 [Flaviaesturariibacter sp.]|nr:hypothetical protein [Flaviaesturariibacter sp.]
MKQFLSLLLLLPFLAGAQDTCGLKRDRDPYTKEVRLSSGFIAVGNNKVSIDAVAKEIDFFFMLEPGKCFDDNATLTVNFEGSRVKQTYRSSGTMNCEGYFHINFRNTPGTSYSLQKLATLRVSSLLFKKEKEETTVLLSEDQKNLFRKAVSCVIAQAKGLIP